MLRFLKMDTNETDGFFCEARRRSTALLKYGEETATTHREKRHGFMYPVKRSTSIMKIMGFMISNPWGNVHPGIRRVVISAAGQYS